MNRMNRTLIAALLALTASSGLAAAQLSAKASDDSNVVVADAAGEHARQSPFDQIRDTAPHTIFDQIGESAPHAPFDLLGATAP